MEQLLLKILNMSYAASWLVLAVLALRLVLQKAPRWIHVLLWAMVGLRLACPVTLESVLSLIPSAEVVSPQTVYDAAPFIHTGIVSVDDAVNPVITQTFAPNPVDSVNPLQVWVYAAGILWLAGVAAMGLYTLISYLRLRCRIGDAVRVDDKVYQSERIDSPFVLGLFMPRIYLPSALQAADRVHVIAHEQAHIARKDHWWKPLGFLLLAVHWFNPLMWVAYVLLCRDIELACDEKVIRRLGAQQRADYSQALLSCSVSRRTIAACPLAFGEVGVKGRVKSILSYKKPGFWILLAAVAACVAVAVCFLTDPKKETQRSYSDQILCVGVQNSDGSVVEEDVKWYYYNLRRGERVTLPGNAELEIFVESVKEDAATLRFGTPLRQEGAQVRELLLKPGGSAELYAGDPGGSTQYTFLTATRPTDTNGGVLEWIGSTQGIREEQTVMVAYFPGVTFHYAKSSVWAEGGSQERWDMMEGMPIQNVYFADLSGDGLPEVCATMSWGSGMIDTYVGVADYMTGERFFLRDRGVCDYALELNDGKLSCVVTDYHSGEELGRGSLTLADAGGGSGRKLVIGDAGDKDGPVIGDADECVVPVVGGADGPENVTVKREMNLVDLVTLKKKGNKITWEDLEAFSCTDVGSGLYIRRYPIADAYQLLVGGGTLTGTPVYVRLVCSECGRFIDLRTDDLMAFLEEHKPETLKAIVAMDVQLEFRSDSLEGQLPTKSDYIQRLHEIVDRLHGGLGIRYMLEPVYAYGVAEGSASTRNSLFLDDDAYASVTVTYADAAVLEDYVPRSADSEVYVQIQRLLEGIQSTPAWQSSPGAYIDAHEEEYRQMLANGAYVLEYCFARFLEGGQTGLNGHNMAIACEDIMLSWGEAHIMDTADRLTGQQWFDTFRMQTESLALRYSGEELKAQYPASWLLLQMLS